jgi:biopolymer transport protein TolR
MKRLFDVFLITAALVVGFPSANAQVPSLQKGISVELAVTHNAVPVPDADHQDSLVVSVTHDGSLHLGVDSVNRTDLAEKLKRRLANQTSSEVYIKADARTSYANVENVMVALRAAGVNGPILITAQTDSSDTGVIVLPKGLKVLTESSSAKSPVVSVQDSGSGPPILMLGGVRVSWETLESALKKRFQSRPARVQLEADGQLPFT